MPEAKLKYPRNVFIVDGIRTPFLKAQNKPGPFAGSDLAVNAGKTLLERLPIAPSDLDEVIVGCVMPNDKEANIARIIALRLGCGKKMPAYTVQRNCGSGMEAIDSAAKDIALGRAELVMAGGTEAMSHAGVLFSDAMVNWLAEWQASKNFKSRLNTLMKFRPQYLKPVIGLINGLTDPLVGLNMGQTAENLAYRFNISRESMDAFALRSHQRAAAAQSKKGLKQVNVLYTDKGDVLPKDTGVRADTSMEKLAKLKPIFDRKFGTVTAGNSSQVTDGAAMLILASEEAVKRYKLPVLGRIIDTEWAGVAPEEMGLGPVHATVPLMQRQNLKIEDIDYWEINEAFAAQVLACLAAYEDDKYCRENLGLEKAFGKIDQEKLNVEGGAIALGHPVGASGARIVLHLLDILKQNHGKLGLASLCIGGGQGGAMLIESI
jgi:acetyl-CoA C-acetyltransferase